MSLMESSCEPGVPGRRTRNDSARKRVSPLAADKARSGCQARKWVRRHCERMRAPASLMRCAPEQGGRGPVGATERKGMEKASRPHRVPKTPTHEMKCQGTAPLQSAGRAPSCRLVESPSTGVAIPGRTPQRGRAVPRRHPEHKPPLPGGRGTRERRPGATAFAGGERPAGAGWT